jgi:hypothetical protein
MSQAPLTIHCLDIPGPRDGAVKKYFAWQQEQVEEEEQKAHYQKACNYLIKEALDLEQIYEDPNVARDLQTEAKVKRGVASRVVSDVGH